MGWRWGLGGVPSLFLGSLIWNRTDPLSQLLLLQQTSPHSLSEGKRAEQQGLRFWETWQEGGDGCEEGGRGDKAGNPLLLGPWIADPSNYPGHKISGTWCLAWLPILGHSSPESLYRPLVIDVIPVFFTLCNLIKALLLKLGCCIRVTGELLKFPLLDHIALLSWAPPLMSGFKNSHARCSGRSLEAKRRCWCPGFPD